MCYRYNKLVPSTVLNYNKLVTELDIETIIIPDSWDCKDSIYCYQPAGHIVTGGLKSLLIQEFGLLYVKDLNTGSFAEILQQMSWGNGWYFTRLL